VCVCGDKCLVTIVSCTFRDILLSALFLVIFDVGRNSRMDCDDDDDDDDDDDADDIFFARLERHTGNKPCCDLDCCRLVWMFPALLAGLGEILFQGFRVLCVVVGGWQYISDFRRLRLGWQYACCLSA